MNRVSQEMLLLVGKVIRPHGSGGLLRIRSYASSGASFLGAGTVFLRPISGEIDAYKVISVTSHKNLFLMKLDGLSGRDKAEKYIESEIFIRKDSLTRDKDEYFWYELLGLEVYLNTGRYLGRLSQVISAGGNDIYVVKKGEKTVYVPAVYEFIEEIDLERNNMIISAMEDLLDLNEV